MSITTEILLRSKMNHFSLIEVPIYVYRRKSGKSNVNKVELLMDFFKLIISYMPKFLTNNLR